MVSVGLHWEVMGQDMMLSATRLSAGYGHLVITEGISCVPKPMSSLLSFYTHNNLKHGYYSF